MPPHISETVPRLLSGRPFGPKGQRLSINIERACRAPSLLHSADAHAAWSCVDQQTRGHHCVHFLPIRSNSFLRERHAVQATHVVHSLMLFIGTDATAHRDTHHRSLASLSLTPRSLTAMHSRRRAVCQMRALRTFVNISHCSAPSRFTVRRRIHSLAPAPSLAHPRQVSHRPAQTLCFCLFVCLFVCTVFSLLTKDSCG
jgi:hypothetical protein